MMESKVETAVPPMPPAAAAAASTASLPHRINRSSSKALTGSTDEEVQLAFKIRTCRETRDFDSLEEAVQQVLRTGAVLSTSCVVQEAQELINNLRATLIKNKATLAKRLTSDKGSSVFFGHSNWDTVMNIMQGIQLAVNRAQTEGTR